MKMDTQAMTLASLRGVRVLNKIVGLQSELPAVEIYDGMPSMSAVLNYLASCGFVPTGFYPVNSVATPTASEYLLNSTFCSGGSTQTPAPRSSQPPLSS